MLLLELRNSLIAASVVGLFYLGAVAAVWLADLNWWLQSAVSTLILADGIYLLRAAIPACPEYLRCLRLGVNDSELYLRDSTIKASVPEVIYYSEYLLILRFRLHSPTGLRRRRRSVLLFPDSLDTAADRSLRRYLRFGDCSA